MAKKSRRRRYTSNQRLPTTTPRSTPTKYEPNVYTTSQDYSWIGDLLVSNPDFVRPVKKRQLAKTQQKSTFPKTYSPTITQQLRRVANPLGKVKSDINKQINPVTRLKLCVGRAMRKEVMHAIKEAGKSGQKSPEWTRKSKIKC